jgi:hypothetical protein
MLSKIKEFFTSTGCNHVWTDERSIEASTFENDVDTKRPYKVELIYIQRCHKCNARREQRFPIIPKTRL